MALTVYVKRHGDDVTREHADIYGFIYRARQNGAWEPDPALTSTTATAQPPAPDPSPQVPPPRARCGEAAEVGTVSQRAAALDEKILLSSGVSKTTRRRRREQTAEYAR